MFGLHALGIAPNLIGGLQTPELLIILVVVILIFGPKNLPKLGKSLGSTVKNIREGMEGDKDDENETVVEESEEDKEIAELEAKLAAAKAKKEEGDSDSDAE